MTLGVAEASDLTAIAALERGAFAHAAWSERAWAEELSAGNRRVWVYRDAAGALCGVATFALAGDVVDLLRVIVAPDARGRGLGRLNHLDRKVVGHAQLVAQLPQPLTQRRGHLVEKGDGTTRHR